MEITLELSCCKHVPPATLAREWQANKESLLAYMERAHMGVKGYVLDAFGRPVEDARVLVEGINKAVKTTARGEYWRVLAPGEYVLQARKDGRGESRPQAVSVRNNLQPVILNLQLEQ